VFCSFKKGTLGGVSASHEPSEAVIAVGKEAKFILRKGEQTISMFSRIHYLLAPFEDKQ